MPNLITSDRFLQAYSRARWQDWKARLGGRPNDLLPFDEIASTLQVYQQIPRPHLQTIPLDKIVGSVGRYKDFTRDFLPRSRELGLRWTKVEEGMESLEGLPPIEVYKVGDVYFVADGNHRVSVARANGFEEIDAYVTEIPVDAGLEPGDSLDEAIIKAERTRFLADTGIDHCYPQLDIFFTRPGGFKQLLEHVRFHRRLMMEEHPDAGEITLREAACDWYEHGYLPILQAIRERQLLQRFPGRTAADLYVWIWGFIFDTYRRLGERISPEEGAEMLALRAGSPVSQAIQGLMSKLNELSGGLFGPPQDVPDWATQTFEWNDGSLEELARTSEGSEVG